MIQTILEFPLGQHISAIRQPHIRLKGLQHACKDDVVALAHEWDDVCIACLDGLHKVWAAGFQQLHAGGHDAVLQDEGHAGLQLQAQLTQRPQLALILRPACVHTAASDGVCTCQLRRLLLRYALRQL